MRLSRRQATEIVLFGIVVGGLLTLLTFWTFQVLALLTYALLSSAALLALSFPSRPARAWFSVPVLVFGFLLIKELPIAMPLRTRLSGVSFNNASIADVLSRISQQRVTMPYWRFFVSDKEAATKKLSLVIRDGCSLGEALDAIMTAGGYRYRWIWHKGCGNAPAPICASFYVWRLDEPVVDDSFWAETSWDLMIERDDVYWAKTLSGKPDHENDSSPEVPEALGRSEE
jgi:hypothetical protein